MKSNLIPNHPAPEICESRGLGSKGSTPEGDENEDDGGVWERTKKSSDNVRIVEKGKSVSGNNKDDESGLRHAYSIISATQGDAVSSSKSFSVNHTSAKGGKSEYSRRRDANIAQNKKLLSELGLLKSSSLLDEPNGKKKKGKKGEKGKKDVHVARGLPR